MTCPNSDEKENLFWSWIFFSGLRVEMTTRVVPTTPSSLLLMDFDFLISDVIFLTGPITETAIIEGLLFNLPAWFFKLFCQFVLCEKVHFQILLTILYQFYKCSFKFLTSTFSDPFSLFQRFVKSISCMNSDAISKRLLPHCSWASLR